MVDFVTGDSNDKISVTCKSASTGAAKDITGYTATLRWLDKSGVLTERTMTIANAAAGIIEYTFASGELFGPRMDFEIRLIDSLGNIAFSQSMLSVYVRTSLA